MKTAVSPQRADAERRVVEELEAWRARAIPDTHAPLDADDVARLVRSCLDALGIEGDAGVDFSVNTVHYYRRKDILDAPIGRTSSARYGVRHVWQAIGARLAGSLGLVTLAEARKVFRGANDDALVAFVAARVLDARGRQRVRESAQAPRMSVRAFVAEAAPVAHARPLPGVYAAATQPALPVPSQVPVVIPLPGEALCLIPATHPAHYSVAAAQDLVRALAAALNIDAR